MEDSGKVYVRFSMLLFEFLRNKAAALHSTRGTVRGAAGCGGTEISGADTGALDKVGHVHGHVVDSGCGIAVEVKDVILTLG